MPEATRLDLICRWEFVIPATGRGWVKISGRVFIVLYTLHLVGQFIALRAQRRCFISSPEFWRRMAASVGPEAAPSSDGIISSKPQHLASRKIWAAKRISLRCLNKISPRSKNLSFFMPLWLNKIYWSFGLEPLPSWVHPQKGILWKTGLLILATAGDQEWCGVVRDKKVLPVNTCPYI